jgi:hypothetical protein
MVRRMLRDDARQEFDMALNAQIAPRGQDAKRPRNQIANL